MVLSANCSVEKQSNLYISFAFRTEKEKWIPECVKGFRESGEVYEMS